jgi:peptidoglycan hydrolase-like protein with peptidoglycan-binding domain
MARALVCMLLASALIAQSGQTKAASTSHSKKAAPHKSAKSRSRSRTGRRRAAGPSYQQHPDSERYKQIQQALADRGYFKGTVDGAWNADSVDALKRFQADQKIDDDGKIDALSLKGLGLGARHDGSSAATVPLSAASSDSEPPPQATPLPQEATPPQ